MPISSYLAPSALAKPGVCTSSTRPASPYQGQAIWETDTSKLLIWNGSGWYAPWNLPWGNIGYVSLTTLSQTGITSAVDVTGATITFTAVANRRYRASWCVYTNTSATGSTTNVFLVEGSTTLQQATATAGAATVGCFVNGQYIGTHAAGSVTWKLRTQLQSGSGTSTVEGGGTYPATFSIDDIGPA